MAPCRNYIHVQTSTATMNKNTGIQSAITNGTPVPPPQVRTTPLNAGGGLRSNRRPTDGSPSPAPAAATTTPSTGGQTAAAFALRPSPPGSSPRIRPEQAARPVTPGPRPAVLQGHQPGPRPRQVNSGVGPANGRPGQAPADQVFFSSQLRLCSR